MHASWIPKFDKIGKTLYKSQFPVGKVPTLDKIMNDTSVFQRGKYTYTYVFKVECEK